VLAGNTCVPNGHALDMREKRRASSKCARDQRVIFPLARWLAVIRDSLLCHVFAARTIVRPARAAVPISSTSRFLDCIALTPRFLALVHSAYRASPWASRPMQQRPAASSLRSRCPRCPDFTVQQCSAGYSRPRPHARTHGHGLPVPDQPA